jgi:hypothetical protein
VLWFACWMFALSTYERGAAEPTDWMTPPGWTGNPWGPAAAEARHNGTLPPIPMIGTMAKWDHWGRTMLRDGDIVFRLGDARTGLGFLPLSRFIAHASGSAFSHTGIIAIEEGRPVVYDCSSSGIQRQPFAVWMLDSIGSFGVKRLKPHLSGHIAGVLGYCRKVFEDQVPFDDEFKIDDSRLYCVEMTEKAFRSQGLALSKPVCIGDWENLVQYPLTALGIVRFSGLTLEHPITLDQPVYLPGNDRLGIWASPMLETVYPYAKGKQIEQPPRSRPGVLSVKGDVAVTAFAVREARRSYSELPWRLIGDLLKKAPAGGEPPPPPRIASGDVRASAAELD